MIDSLSAAAALLLAVAGAAKIRTPAPAVAMLGRAWSRLRRARALSGVIRAVGAGEIAVGAAVLAHGGRAAAALLAACYLAFAAVAIRLMARGERSPCGCFGRADAPVGRAHLVLDIVCVVAASAATVRPTGSVAGFFDHGVLVAATRAAQVLLLTWLGYLSITALPALAAARRRLMEAR